MFLIFEVFLLLHCSKGIYILNNIIYSYVHLKNGFLASIFKGVRIGFGEVDYSVSEGNGKAVVLVTQAEPITENLTVPIVAITYEEFFGSGRTLPSDFDDVELPNPAECKCDIADNLGVATRYDMLIVQLLRTCMVRKDRQKCFPWKRLHGSGTLSGGSRGGSLGYKEPPFVHWTIEKWVWFFKKRVCSRENQ